MKPDFRTCLHLTHILSKVFDAGKQYSNPPHAEQAWRTRNTDFYINPTDSTVIYHVGTHTEIISEKYTGHQVKDSLFKLSYNYVLKENEKVSKEL